MNGEAAPVEDVFLGGLEPAIGRQCGGGKQDEEKAIVPRSSDFCFPGGGAGDFGVGGEGVEVLQ